MRVSARPEELPRPAELTVRQLAVDVAHELRTHPRLPPGPRFDPRHARRLFVTRPLSVLLPCYERYGPVFTIRAVQRRQVWMLGPAANHYVLVENAGNFSWRQGDFGGLTPLLGDGLITTDGQYHDAARRTMMPAFHRRSLDAALTVMIDEARRALAAWRPGNTVDVYEWSRELALRIAMRALLGLDPDGGGHAHEAAVEFERALGYYGVTPPLQAFRGPGTPWSRLRSATRALDGIVYGEIERRGRTGPRDSDDVLAMLLAAGDFSDRELRDHVLTLLFGGHDTSSSTLSFLLYELARHPESYVRVTEEIDAVLGGQPAGVDVLMSELPELDLAVDETLRLYPPVWFSPRRAVDAFEFAGHAIPAGSYVYLSSHASHRLPDVFDAPDAWRPDRFAPAARKLLPKGAYIPFGGGQRICIGKRFGQLVVKAVAAELLQSLRLEPLPGHVLGVHTQPTLSPKGGLPMVVSFR